MDMLTLTHVKKSFGEKAVLKDVSFSVPEHTILGFVGANGAGKTTTMKLILGLLQADGGKLWVSGEEVHYGNTHTNRWVGYLPDVPEFYSFMTPTEYLCFCGGITGMREKEAKLRAEELLKLVGLEEENRRIKGFSRGMKQRLGIAQALFNRPKLLICDEPTSALDPVGRKEILDILRSVKEETTVLFSTHILSDVERICDHAAFLHEGKIVLEGTMKELENIHGEAGYEIEPEYGTGMEALGVFLTEQGLKMEKDDRIVCGSRRQAESVLEFLLARHIPIRRMEKRETDLEALFLEVTGRKGAVGR